MAKRGYVVFAVKAWTRGRPADLRPLNDLDGSGTDLLAATASVASVLAGRTRPERNDRYEQAYQFTELAPASRALVLEGKSGAYGSAGSLVDVDAGHSADFTDRQAPMTPLRAMLFREPQARFGVLICERTGSKHLKDAIRAGLFTPIQRHCRVTIDVQPHVDRRAWQHYLDNAQPLSVTTVWRSQRAEDYLPQSSKPSRVKMTATGALAARHGTRVLRRAFGMAMEDGNVGPSAYVNIADLTPQSEGFEPERQELDLRDGDTTRHIVIERGELPQWVYPFGGRARLSQDAMVTAWADHAPTLLSPLQTRLGSEPDPHWPTTEFPEIVVP